MDSLPGISIEAIIERLFRFIEMVVIATLIGVVMTVVSPEASKLASSGLALLAGTFVGVPVGRWLATRYDKLGSSFLAMAKLACIRLRLRHYESTA
jgi:hypothetical protein